MPDGNTHIKARILPDIEARGSVGRRDDVVRITATLVSE